MAENDRGRPCQDAPDVTLAKADTVKDTPTLAAVAPNGIGVLDAELAELLDRIGTTVPTTQAALTDVERIALGLVDTFGPTWSRRLAHRLFVVSEEVTR